MTRPRVAPPLAEPPAPDPRLAHRAHHPDEPSPLAVGVVFATAGFVAYFLGYLTFFGWLVEASNSQDWSGAKTGFMIGVWILATALLMLLGLGMCLLARMWNAYRKENQ